MLQAKLVSPHDTLLGTITYPPEWHDNLHGRGYVNVAYLRPRDLHVILEERVDSATMVRSFTIVLARHSDFPDAVRLLGVTLEEFEQIPGCSFAPGAAYLRSLVA